MFVINGDFWKIKFVKPNSAFLRRSDGGLTVAVTDYNTHTVYLSDLLQGFFLKKVICHEIVHCFAFSYDEYFDIEDEERLADFIATYGEEIIRVADEIFRMLKRKINR